MADVLGLANRVPPAALGALAVVVLSVFAVEPLFHDGVILAGDNLHPMRLYQMHRCIDDGQLPCRWTPDLGGGYGFPLFNYYPPLPYYAGDVVHRLGFSYLRTVDLLYVVGLTGAGLSMFLLGRRLWGDLGGLVSAVAYMYAPYLALNVYMRGALAELWALAVAPALFWALAELLTSARLRFVPLVALFVALLLLSHNLVAVIVAPGLALWAAVLLAGWGRAAWRPGLLGAVAAVWGVGLAAFFTLPALFEGDLVHLDNLTTAGFHYSEHFASVRDLFFLRSADYSFLLRVRIGTPLQIGWFHWGLAALALPAAVVFARSKATLSLLSVPVFAVLFGVGVFMTASVSRFVWDSFEALRFMQFPWRYLGLVSLSAAVLAGVWLAVLRDRPLAVRLGLAAVLVALFIGSGRDFFQPYYRQYYSDGDLVSGERFASAQRGSLRDYLPKAVEAVPQAAPAAPARTIVGRVRLTDGESGTDWLRLELEAATPARIEAAVFDFPEWRVRVDGRPVPHEANPPYGLVAFEVPPGRHTAELRLEDTGVRRAGNLLSLVSWSLLALAVAAFPAGWLLGRRGEGFLGRRASLTRPRPARAARLD